MFKTHLASLLILTTALSTAGCASAGQYQGYERQRDNRGYSEQSSSDRWSQRYSNSYALDQGQDCRSSSDPAGVVAGAVIGGLLGNALGRGGGRAGATIAGVVVGGAVGAAMTNKLDCEDRRYANQSYADGFSAGREDSRVEWRNPRNDHRGEMRVRNYYDDQDGFRCARFTQTLYLQGRAESTNGVACRQPDGRWAVVN
jgi:surface antigen